jgi:hypothetical protein
MADAASEPVKCGYGDYIEKAAPGVLHQPIQFGPGFLATTRPVAVDGGNGPAALLTEAPEAFLLDLWTLAVFVAIAGPGFLRRTRS